MPGFSLPLRLEENFAAIHPEDRAGQREIVEQAVAAGGSVWVRASGAVVGAGGKASRVVGITQNSTQRKRVEEALKDLDETLGAGRGAHCRIAEERAALLASL